ncbi:hypothetical protein B0T09DRAFT_325529 [Sordaria sp. MPI-SDFR-AT-0083]|nr:hypothetical protein B0T09DRAFT_325529 [Sordaria sp. MPI-SDFR-AT-0083]
MPNAKGPVCPEVDQCLEADSEADAGGWGGRSGAIKTRGSLACLPTIPIAPWWTSLALNSHVIARDYEPSGRVPVLEVFYGDPIADVAPSKAEWLEKKLSGWADFVDDARFHEVQGHHYTLLAPENIDLFARTFVARLAGRRL